MTPYTTMHICWIDKRTNTIYHTVKVSTARSKNFDTMMWRTQLNAIDVTFFRDSTRANKERANIILKLDRLNHLL